MRPRRLLPALLACLAAAAFAAPAGAAPGDPLVPSGPADGARLSAGAPPLLRVQSVEGDAGLELRVSARPDAIDACGRINAEVAQAPGTALADDPTVYDFPAGRWYEQPGTYYWQVVRTDAGGSCEATAVRTLRLLAPAAAAPPPPPAGRPSTPPLPPPPRAGKRAPVVLPTRRGPPRGPRGPGP